MLIRKLKDWKFERKMAKQRAKKGYCDLDVWNIDNFIETTLVEILKEFKKDNNGYPPELTPEEWDKIIDRMIFLLTEMNEETCSMRFDLGDKPEKYFEVSEYRTKCKDEFYDLLKRWHWALWW